MILLFVGERVGRHLRGTAALLMPVACLVAGSSHAGEKEDRAEHAETCASVGKAAGSERTTEPASCNGPGADPTPPPKCKKDCPPPPPPISRGDPRLQVVPDSPTDKASEKPEPGMLAVPEEESRSKRPAHDPSSDREREQSQKSK